VSARSVARSAVPSRSAAAFPLGGAVRACRATPVRPELRLVPGLPPRVRRRSLAAPGSRAPFVLLVVALLVGTTLGLLVLNTVIAVDSLKATSLRAENAERAQEVQRLEQQVTSAGTPAEIARAAEAAGLVPAGTPGYLVLDPDGGAVLRGAPEPAPQPGEQPGAGTPAGGGD
jgi:hypothetical protein